MSYDDPWDFSDSDSDSSDHYEDSQEDWEEESEAQSSSEQQSSEQLYGSGTNSEGEDEEEDLEGEESQSRSTRSTDDTKTETDDKSIDLSDVRSGSELESLVSFQRFSVDGRGRQHGGRGGGDANSMTTYSRVPTSQRSPSPEVETVVVDEDIARELIKEEYGRTVSNYSDLYFLPLDEEERDRLRKQHEMFIAVMGGKYPPPMGAVLASTVPGEKAVLDLGAGSGCWIKDVARDFPLCEAVAVDLVPLSDDDDLPPNVRTEVDDINYGLAHFHNSFDVVHVRLLVQGIRDYRELVHDITHVLRPGGLVEYFQNDFQAYDANFQRVEVDLNRIGAPWWPLWLGYMVAAARARGIDTTVGEKTAQWLRDSGEYENVVSNLVWLPVVPGTNPVHNEFVCENMRVDLMVSALASALLCVGPR
ncbi:hypothetical protein EST38_g4160 [Candolleomyces aberdarensis]|uniref:Methyltransferase domain-containing protein n=1 Tax=Candolleomyces aberdarensis TaxID=2316362 RepID=A0A4Q2DNR0_9AGAR|nr:hypothetical protein EST38_g4160 [Candolleomyces aberdarensis]